MELELRRLEDLAESIVNDFAYMRAREEEMRDICCASYYIPNCPWEGVLSLRCLLIGASIKSFLWHNYYMHAS